MIMFFNIYMYIQDVRLNALRVKSIFKTTVTAWK